MAKQQLLISFASLLLLSTTLAFVNASEDQSSSSPVPPAKHHKKVDVVVEGMVYCQSCKYYGTWSLTDAKPIPSAKVSVTCKNHKNILTFYKIFVTDEGGYFYAPLDGYKREGFVLDHPLHSCEVRLVASPLPACNSPTNINYGLNGASLRYENKRISGSNYEAVIYAAGPLAFRPGYCPSS
ncbi:Pollen ole e 1 allergen and extensin family protein [Thalictrum thalictroides]|uniref:Pollen ole e 1 allergen and extensin family protein n=1 Tax=Thalictrum thalictroides TaxID=46969 RepID=A0A7J6VA69_THATH|nr:Pollen ole e 1 allergen and extensin family protein [Thalictrum thalictroides]